MNAPALHGVMAGFGDAARLLGAAQALRARGYRELDAYSPYPVAGLAAALGAGRRRVPLLVLLGGIAGGFGTLALEGWSAIIDYPIDVGGRPPASWPAFIPPALEMALLFAALAGVAGMLALNRLPRFHHPVFDVDRFGSASRDGFVLVVRADDARFDATATRGDLDALGASWTAQVPQ
jgi:hypothetical protein